jgi:GT2 family glycosyltransferase
MKRGRIYTVHYGDNLTTTADFVDALTPFLTDQLDVVVVNNAQAGVLDYLRNRWVYVVDTGENRGYFGGAKDGMERYPLGERDFAVVCNNDVRFTRPDFFSVLADKLEHWDVIAPHTVTLDGVCQNPHRSLRPSTLRKRYHRLYFANYGIACLLDGFYAFKQRLVPPIKSEKAVEKAIFSPHGACIIFNATFFARGGFLDDGYFLYGEEDSVAATAADLGLKVGYVSELSVLHLESATTGKRLSRAKYAHQKEAYRYISRAYPIYFGF